MSEWVETALGHLFAKVTQGGTPDTGNAAYWNGNIPWISGADFDGNKLSEFRRYVSPVGVVRSSTAVVKKGDLLVVTRTGVGKLAIAPCDIAISQDLTGITANAEVIETSFLFRLLSREVEELKKLNQGTSINGITRSDLERHCVKFPKDPEYQKKIAAILETVDEAIEQTEALIGKYEQVKAGMMQDLFTRGLMPDGKLRPPREEAPDLYQETPIGWIPKDWEVGELGVEIGKIQSGWSPLCDSEAAAAGQWAILKTTAVVWDGYNPSKNKRLPSNLMGRHSIETRAGDILITRKGPVERVGVVVYVFETPARLMFPDTVFRTTVLNPNKLTPEFLALSLQSSGVQNFWAQRKIGLAEAQVNINHGILRKTPFPKPAPTEQAAILRRNNEVSLYLRRLGAELQKRHQQKSGLMADLLTGKVPVSV